MKWTISIVLFAYINFLCIFCFWFFEGVSGILVLWVKVSLRMADMESKLLFYNRRLCASSIWRIVLVLSRGERGVLSVVIVRRIFFFSERLVQVIPVIPTPSLVHVVILYKLCMESSFLLVQMF
jgi:hypothetical protein